MVVHLKSILVVILIRTLQILLLVALVICIWNGASLIVVIVLMEIIRMFPTTYVLKCSQNIKIMLKMIFLLGSWALVALNHLEL